MAIHLDTVVVGAYMVNCYLYGDDETGDAYIIDPGDEAEQIAHRVDTLKFQPQAILLTHGHLDHIGAVEELRSRYDIPVLIGAGEEELLSDPTKNGSALLGMPITTRPPEKLLADEDIAQYGKLRLRVLATPGHSPAGVCYLDEYNGYLFCGDTLFMQSIGRTDLYGASFDILIRSIQRQILTLPDNVMCYPGHGPHTTVGGERRSNPFLTGGTFV